MAQAITGSVENLISNPVCPSKEGLMSVPAVYNKGIRIVFSPTYNPPNSDKYPDFDLSTYVSGFDGVVQNALTDTLTTQGTDIVYPARGTTFRETAVEGSLPNANALAHAANFAAEEVKTFNNNQINFDTTSNSTANFSILSEAEIAEQNNVPTITKYSLTPTQLSYDSVILEAYFEASSGETRGVEIENTLIENTDSGIAAEEKDTFTI